MKRWRWMVSLCACACACALAVLVVSPPSSAQVSTVGGVPLVIGSGVETLPTVGCSGNPDQVTASWSRVGSVVQITLDAYSCTSDSTLFAAVGLPFKAPSNPTGYVALHRATNNGTAENGTVAAKLVHAGAGSTLVFARNGSDSGWSATGSKGWPVEQTLTFLLD